MAFVTGTAASYAALKTAVETACVAVGWTLADDILSKGSAFVQLRVATPSGTGGTQQGTGLAAFPGTGKSGTTLLGTVSNAPRLGPLTHPDTSYFKQIDLPFDYFIFTFTAPDEVYVIARRGSYYTRLCFGVSKPLGAGGNGLWVDASVYGCEGYGDHGYNGAIIGAASGSASSRIASTPSYPCITGMWQNTRGHWYGTSYSSSLINTGAGWMVGGPLNYAGQCNAIEPIDPLVSVLQSGSFADPPLLPIRVHQCISATENRVVLEVENARYFRLKNHEPEAIIQRGGSQWMVFPWLRKDGTVAGDVGVATHSGTFGWAIRYEGP